MPKGRARLTGGSACCARCCARLGALPPSCLAAWAHSLGATLAAAGSPGPRASSRRPRRLRASGASALHPAPLPSADLGGVRNASQPEPPQPCPFQPPEHSAGSLLYHLEAGNREKPHRTHFTQLSRGAMPDNHIMCGIPTSTPEPEETQMKQ